MIVRPLDVMAVALVAIAVFFSAAVLYGKGSGEALVLVEATDGRRYYPIDKDVTVPIPGPLGETILVIHGGRAYIETSPCKNKTCVLSGSVGAVGGWIACLPNRVFISVTGTPEQESVDAGAW